MVVGWAALRTAASQHLNNVWKLRAGSAAYVNRIRNTNLRPDRTDWRGSPGIIRTNAATFAAMRRALSWMAGPSTARVFDRNQCPGTIRPFIFRALTEGNNDQDDDSFAGAERDHGNRNDRDRRGAKRVVLL